MEGYVWVASTHVVGRRFGNRVVGVRDRVVAWVRTEVPCEVRDDSNVNSCDIAGAVDHVDNERE